MKFKMLFTVILTTALTHNLFAFTENCEIMETTGNSVSQVLEEGLQSQYTDKELEIISTQTLVTRKVHSLSFDKCSFQLTVDFDLEREVLGNTTGNIVLSGTVTEIDEKHLCLKEINGKKLVIEGASQIEIELYLAAANMALPETHCFEWE